jgi:hypothetical protein
MSTRIDTTKAVTTHKEGLNLRQWWVLNFYQRTHNIQGAIDLYNHKFPEDELALAEVDTWGDGFSLLMEVSKSDPKGIFLATAPTLLPIMLEAIYDLLTSEKDESKAAGARLLGQATGVIKVLVEGEFRHIAMQESLEAIRNTDTITLLPDQYREIDGT